MSLFADNMIAYIENPVESNKKLFDLMNMAKQQNTKSIFRNRRHFCSPTMKHQKQKSGGKIPFPIATKNNVPRNKPYQGCERPVLRKLHNTEERN